MRNVVVMDNGNWNYQMLLSMTAAIGGNGKMGINNKGIANNKGVANNKEIVVVMDSVIWFKSNCRCP